MRQLCCALVMVLGGCSDDVAPSAISDLGTAASDAATTAEDTSVSDAEKALLSARPYTPRVPASYDPTTATPLLIALHGLGSNGSVISLYLGFNAIADSKNFFYVAPEGTRGSAGQYWNATDACCDVTLADNVDDVGYIRAIIHDMRTKYNIDGKRIFVVGHSNGGFMSHRVACDVADEVAAIASVAGANWKDASKCQPTQPVAVVEIHGDMDATVHYGGGHGFDIQLAPEYPSVQDTMAIWALRNGCSGSLAATGISYDLVSTIAGAETQVEAYDCSMGAAELWTMQGAPHEPAFVSDFATQVWDNFLSQHPKP